MSASAFSPNSSRRQPLQRRHIGLVVGGDALEIVDRGDHLGGDVMALRDHAQQHLEQFDDRARRWPPACARSQVRQGLRIARQPALDRGDDRLAPARALEALGQRAQVRELARGVVGACTAMSPIASSLSTRERGTSRDCASRSRQAATSISTASSFGLRTRVFSRCQAFSGSMR